MNPKSYDRSYHPSEYGPANVSDIKISTSWSQKGYVYIGLPVAQLEESACIKNVGDPFDPWVGEDPLEKELATLSNILARETNKKKK